MFVITSELFDSIIGKHFRDLAFTRGKVREILLVVNKMGIDPGTPEIKLPDIAKVTKPQSPRDFRTAFIDAKSYLEALEETDAEDQADLFHIAKFGDFITQLNTFVHDCELMGRLTTPLFSIRSAARQAEAFLQADLPEERAAIELLYQKRNLFSSSGARLRETLRGVLSAACVDITTYGDEIAEKIEPGSTEDNVQAQHKQGQKRAEQRYSQLKHDAKSAVEEELRELGRRLKELDDGVLAKELRGKVASTRVEDVGNLRRIDDLKGEWTASESTRPADWPARLKKVSDIANRLGEFAASWTTGPFAQAANIGTATASRGSQAHTVIYNVGKFFGTKFKPWGTVNAARIIGNLGRIIATIGPVLVVVAQILEEKQQEERRRKLRDARDFVRSSYREAVRAIEAEFWASYDGFSQDFYDAELKAIDALRDDLIGRRQARSQTADTLEQIASESQALIQELQERPLSNATRPNSAC